VFPTSNQDGHQAKNRKKGGMKFKKESSPLKLQSQSQPNFAEMIVGIMFEGPNRRTHFWKITIQ
jgi:hypothetical protein